jgi:hydroxyacylglutathione hydrolase
MSDNQIIIIPSMGDNYSYLIVSGKWAAVVDPGEADPVIKAINQKGLELSLILITHHHFDHCGGVGELKRKYKCTEIGSDEKHIAGLDKSIKDGDIIEAGNDALQVIDIKGHTSSHVGYYSKNQKTLFTGDTLFCCGCGRIFEGNPSQMYQSLLKLAQFPDDTLVYPGHEYTVENIEFALTVEKDNPDLIKRSAEVKKMRNQGEPTVPSTIGLEKKTNPFLRPFSPSIRKSLNMQNEPDVEVFAELRRRKDRF